MTDDSFNLTAYIVFHGVLDYDNAWSTSWVPTFVPFSGHKWSKKPTN